MLVDTSDVWHLNVELGRRYRLEVKGLETGHGTSAFLEAALWPLETYINRRGNWKWVGTWIRFDESDLTSNRSFEFTPRRRIAFSYAATGGPYIAGRTYFSRPVVWHAYVDFGDAERTVKGTYTLVLTDITDQEDESELGGQHTMGRVMVGGSVTGNLSVDGDLDWFRVDLEADRTYRFRLRGAESGGGTLEDPLMLLYSYDIGDYLFAASYTVENTDELPFNNDKSATEKDSEMTYTADRTGIYFIEANTPGTGTGTYTIEVEDVTN